MSLETLAQIKVDLGISGSGEDTTLTKFLREACAVIRKHCGAYIGGKIESYTAANPTVCTAIGHELESGDTIVIANSNGTSIDGSRVVTRVSDDTFTVPVNVASVGTAGDYYRTLTEYYAGNGRRELQLNQRPVISIGSVYEDTGAYYGEASGAFASTTLLTAGTQYCLLRDNGDKAEQSLGGILLRLGGVWPAGSEQLRGMLTTSPAPGLGNIKVTYNAGYAVVPADVRRAVAKLVAEIRVSAGQPSDIQSESLDYYSYSKMSADEQAKALTSVKGLLKRYKRWVI